MWLSLSVSGSGGPMGCVGERGGLGTVGKRGGKLDWRGGVGRAEAEMLR